MHIDIYKVRQINTYFVIPTGVTPYYLALPEEIEGHKLTKIKSCVPIRQAQQHIGVISDDIISQIRLKGYATLGAELDVETVQSLTADSVW